MRSFLKTLSSEERRERSQKLSRLLHEVMEPQRHLLWGVFAPLADEPLWDMEFSDYEVKRAYPMPGSSLGEMGFLLCEKEQLSEQDVFGTVMSCPPAGQPEACPEALLVPALAYSREGVRLGRGSGYYDRVLKNYGGTRIGVCFDEQLCFEVPEENHDQKVEVVVTEKQVIFCHKGEESWTQLS